MRDRKVKISSFKPEYTASFVQLNLEWIETYFEVEKTDREQLEGPQEKILDIGGQIFFILEDDKVVGTCAMIPHGEHGYELAKMAVSPSSKGKGYGDLLMMTAIRWAQEKGAQELILLSNTILEPAISLYIKHGFSVASLGSHPDYKRCNIEMVLKF